VLVAGLLLGGAAWLALDDGARGRLAALLREANAGGESAAPADRPEGAVPLRVHSVHDGDTLRLRAAGGTGPGEPGWLADLDAGRVRLIGIDAPEVGERAECYGAEATAALRALAPEGSTVWGVSDVEEHDRYGRVLLYLWTDDGRFIQAELASAGAVEALVVGGNDTHAELLASLEEQARDAGRGQWSACR
jgi:micrococcal nuclease